MELIGASLSRCNRPDDGEGFHAGNDGVGQGNVGGSVGQVFLAGVEAQEGAAFLDDVARESCRPASDNWPSPPRVIAKSSRLSNATTKGGALLPRSVCVGSIDKARSDLRAPAFGSHPSTVPAHHREVFCQNGLATIQFPRGMPDGTAHSFSRRTIGSE